MKTITILTTCYNEEENVEQLYEETKRTMEKVRQEKGYDYEHLFIDNDSTDGTVAILRRLAANDPRVKVILNAKNAGWVRSFQYAITQTHTDAVFYLEADFQTPPDNIPRFIDEWEKGAEVVAGIKVNSEERWIIRRIRKIFYRLLRKFSDVDIIENFLGVGLFDKSFIDRIRGIDDSYPFFRGMVAELGVGVKTITYDHKNRRAGKSHFNFLQMYDLAMLGFTSYTKIPLRIASFFGYACAFASIIVAIITFIQKLIHWDSFTIGTAAISIGLFFFASVQLIFLGLIGEYISAILVQTRKRPWVIEKERINF